MRDEKEKEKTKIRERERRAITTNIFRGLRKHGNYPLSARADINQVLRHLAAEAGWVVEPDGTTYRASSVTRGTEKQVGKNCPLCGSAKSSTTSTPTSSVIISGRGGECSTTVSSRTLSIEEPSLVDVNRPNQLQLRVSSHERSSSTLALAKSSPIVPYAHGGPENLHYSMLEQQLCLHKQEASITARDSAAHQFPTLMTPLMDGNHGR